MNYRVVEYDDTYRQEIIDLILPIQQKEFQVPVTLHDQPDVQDISTFYKKGKGNFWVALCDDVVVGTIGMIEFNNNLGALRKMFVHRGHRGKHKGVAQLLLNELVNWCKEKKVKGIYLGTIDSMHAAHRFYEKNGFTELSKEKLPPTFPLMRVDNKFFGRILV